MSSLSNRREFILTSFAGVVSAGAGISKAAETTEDPWSQNDLLSPSDLAAELAAGQKSLQIICVTFPNLFRQRHIRNAVLAGPGNKPEGLEALRRTTSKAGKESEIALYCGCCPMKDCPNIRPAFRTLKEQGFNKVRVLNLVTNFHNDWVVKGYPVET